jgi:hlyD family secretion protein
MNHRSKKIISYIIALVIIVCASLWIGNRFVRLGNVEFTDNARIGKHIVPVNCRIQGYIKEIRFDEFEEVHRGDTLVIIDDTDFQLARERAAADYHSAMAGNETASRNIVSASANAGVSDAAIAEAKILMDNARTDLDRYEQLLARGAATRQEYDRFHTDYEAKKARYETMCRQRASSGAVVQESMSRRIQSEAGVEIAEIALKTAEQNLSYTVITAPCDGYTSRKEIQEGQLVQPGQTLLDLVDNNEVWVTANYKETQLCHIYPGSKVEITVDAIPDKIFHGTVRSISTATGASLSLLPQDNSAGNFVKVRQRVPVRIDFSGLEEAERNLLRAGMNVECEIKY